MYNAELPLFGNTLFKTPTTQGIKYVGSKLKLIPHILSLLNDLDVKTVFDGFSGTTRVAQALAQSGFSVISNDIAEWSYTFGVCYLHNKRKPREYRELIAHLNAVKGYDGWFTQHYGGYDFAGSAVQPNGMKKPWQVHNTRKLDGIRAEIDALALPAVEKAVALSSLMLALDAVESTLGHFSSYLKEWSPRSYKTMQLQVPKLFENTQSHTVIKGDVFDTVKNVHADCAYFDPPYGSNNEKMPPSRVRYAAYYHIWATICKNDTPNVFGAAQRREDSADTRAASPFEEFRKDANGNFIAVQAIDQLVQTAQAKYVLLSYSSGGKATAQQLNEICKRHGKLLQTLAIDYQKNVMTNMKWTNEWLREAQAPHKEFLFLLEKYS